MFKVSQECDLCGQEEEKGVTGATCARCSADSVDVFLKMGRLVAVYKEKYNLTRQETRAK